MVNACSIQISSSPFSPGINPIDAETARQYGEIKESLRAKGRPIPENDIWIAAIAFQYQLSLVTRDQHFSEIKGLAIKTW